MPRVAIIGGGITGLAAAWELQKHGVDYMLFEASNRLGGKIVTKHVDGFTIEGGPDPFLTSKPWAWQLCRELGLADRMIGTNDAQRNVYIWKHGKLHPYPKGMRLIVPVEEDGLLASELLSEEGKRRMLAEIEMQPYDSPADESLAAFVRRHFGQEALEVFGEPLLAGIYVGDPETMSIRATFPQYVEMERTHGSLIRAMREAPPTKSDPEAPKSAFFSLKGGTQELVDALASRLTGDVHTLCRIERVEEKGGQFSIEAETFPDDLIADVIICSVTPEDVDNIFWDAAEIKAILSEFRTASSLTISLGYHKSQVLCDLDGFGFLIAASESTLLQACTWSSTKLIGRAPADDALIRVFLRLDRLGIHENSRQVDPINIARDELAQYLGIDKSIQPLVSSLHYWRNPQYNVGHLERVAEVESLCPPGLFLAGSAYRGVGVPDCIHQGQIAAQKAMAHLSRVRMVK